VPAIIRKLRNLSGTTRSKASGAIGGHPKPGDREGVARAVARERSKPLVRNASHRGEVTESPRAELMLAQPIFHFASLLKFPAKKANANLADKIDACSP
jgi:hypothetical protein